MLEQKMKEIKSLLDSLQFFFSEDKEAKKEIYLQKLEKTLDLTIQFLKKSSKEKKHIYSYSDQKLNERVEIIINLDSDTNKWQLKTNKGINSYITSKELSQYYWENQMDIKGLITYLFEYINNFFSKKQRLVTAEKDKYNTEISCLQEAISNLEELINIDISEEIKNINS